MVKLKIIKKDNYLYTLEDDNNVTYNFELEFLDVSENPQIGECIWVNEQLINSKYGGYSLSYIFGSLKNKYGKENIQMDDIDVIKLILDDKEIYLKRLYG